MLIRSLLFAPANRPDLFRKFSRLAADIFVDRELRARIRFLRSTPVLITCFPTRGGNRLDNFPVENEFRRVRSGTRREHPDTRIGSA